MPTRLPPMLDRALLLAHRGGRVADVDEAIAGVTRALTAGATGWHGDARLTADGAVVVSRDGLARRFPRRRITELDRAALPEGIADLAAVVKAAGPVPVSLDVADLAAGRAVIEVMRAAEAADRLWLGHADLEVLAALRDRAPEVRFVNVAVLDELPAGPERRGAELAAARIDAVRLAERTWTGGLTTLFHRFEVLAFADDAHHDRQFVRLVDMGIDAIVSEQVDRMAAAAALFEDL